MKTLATRYEVQVNGKLVADATVNISDQLEINLVSLTEQDGAVLALTAFVPGAEKRENYIHTNNTVLSPGDVVTITLAEVHQPAATSVNGPSRTDDEDVPSGPTMTCSFCGKSQLEVGKIIAGKDVFICDECVKLCHEIVIDET